RLREVEHRALVLRVLLERALQHLDVPKELLRRVIPRAGTVGVALDVRADDHRPGRVVRRTVEVFVYIPDPPPRRGQLREDRPTPRGFGVVRKELRAIAVVGELRAHRVTLWPHHHLVGVDKERVVAARLSSELERLVPVRREVLPRPLDELSWD